MHMCHLSLSLSLCLGPEKLLLYRVEKLPCHENLFYNAIICYTVLASFLELASEIGNHD